jgi:hypothetical protein
MRVFVALAALALASCGPIQSGALVVDAQAELSAAQTAQGDKHAPFEYTAAEEYLHKAREEQSYAEFERAVDFARKSRDCARVARTKAEQVTRKEMGALELGPTTKARCRPGPERMKEMLDPDQEPAAQPVETTKPAAPPAKKKVAPAKKEAEPQDPKPEAPRQVVKPKDEMPEGDAEDKE